MARDQEIVKRLQQRLKHWHPNGPCPAHSPGFYEGRRCTYYDEQGRLVKLHLCVWLVQIPSEVWQCLSLQELFLSHNQLRTLPAEVGQLSSLQTLDLSSNQLSMLPAEVGQLSSLQKLSLSNNELSTLPAEVGQLSSLQELNLFGNQFRTLPAEVGQLSSLQELSLHANELSTLPAEADQLSSLQKLNLVGNQLSMLPAEVGNLSSLQELNLAVNRLRTLPAEVGNLSSLRELSLACNQLRTLPAEVGNLSSLQKLDLAENQLRTLPAEVGQLSSLQALDLSNNQLRTLPAEVGQLSSLQELDLTDNPLQPPLSELVEQGIPSILAYLRSLLPVKIFYCYAHEDKNPRDLIDKHLSVLKRLGHVVGWYDREIQAGTDWKREIERNLRTASIILLLVSADFFASDYCYGVEMKKALELHRTGRARVIPILLRPVDWQNAPFADLQILPKGAIPITKWPDPEEALEDVAKEIRRVVVPDLRTHKS